MLDAREITKLRSLMTHEDVRLPIVFSALSDPNRCQIFRSFLKRERLCVSDIAKTFSISMSLASQHLKVLEITGLLRREKEGRTVYYSPRTDDELVRTIIEAVQHTHVQHHDAR
jgi:DNA-binding transcriptional ArsR family regulator